MKANTAKKIETQSTILELHEKFACAGCGSILGHNFDCTAQKIEQALEKKETQMTQNSKKSSPVESFTYNEKTSEMTLVVRGQKQVYENAPINIYNALRDAPSKGTFYNTVLRKSGLRYTKIA